jgi:hypothetical protein
VTFQIDNSLKPPYSNCPQVTTHIDGRTWNEVNHGGPENVPAELVRLVERTARSVASWSNTALRSSGGKGKIRRSGFDALCTFG